MKTLEVEYTFRVKTKVVIDDSGEPPKPYTREAWEKQQLLDQGDDISDSIGFPCDWTYRIL